MPLPLDDVDRVASAKLLGVVVQENTKMDNFVLSLCNETIST